jgi:hypothetical protein
MTDHTYVSARDPHQPPAEIMTPLPAADVSTIWIPQPAAHETTSATDRAVAFLIRLAPLTIILVILAAGMALAFDWQFAWALLAFSALSACAYYAHMHLDHQYSTNGLERHRIDAATSMRKHELNLQARTRLQALREYTRLLESQNHAPEAQTHTRRITTNYRQPTP